MTALKDVAKSTANTSTECLQTVLKTVGHSPPPSFSWTSHSLRKGATLAANAIKAPLNNIRYAGGLSTSSTVPEANFIDIAMPPSKAAYIFFGHLKRETPAEQ